MEFTDAFTWWIVVILIIIFQKMKIIIVDDNDLFRMNIKFYLEKKLKHKVIAEARSGNEFFKIPNKNSADIILMDIVMNDTDGIAATKKVLQDINLRIVALTMHIEKVFLVQLIGAGFKGCVFKTNVYSELENALNDVYAGKFYFPENIKTEMA
jgi:two-component system, NarL family, response regulator LiaR